MVLLGVVLAFFACPNEVLGVGEGHRLVEAMSEGFPYEGPRGNMVHVDVSMNVEEQLLPHFRGNTSEVEMPAHKLIPLGMPHQPASVSDVVRKDPTLEEVREGRYLVLLVPRWMG